MSPCRFDYYDYASEFEGLTLDQIRDIALALQTSVGELMKRDWEGYSGRSTADVVRRRREELGYSVQELSDIIGFQPLVVEALESGSGEATCLAALREIASALRLPLELLIGK